MEKTYGLSNDRCQDILMCSILLLLSISTMIQQKDDKLELRLVAKEKEMCFQKARDALHRFLMGIGVEAEIFLSDAEPEASPISGKFKHIVAFHGTEQMLIS